ncbi:MAG: universal stress protein [Candidatus Promineifilaceae bacterium]
MYQKILVPLDGSFVAEEAIPNALELCRLSKGTLTLVRVVPSATQPPALYSMTDAETCSPVNGRCRQRKNCTWLK